ncbi:DUF1648 domain-containing protein [Streptomyces albus]|uniref:DUF1648 domain-containing protein n=1 Tax=Streptomyces albus TaxID=1888 RepID=UPI003404A454
MHREGQQKAEDTRFPWLWLLPGFLVVLGLVVWGIVVYPDLPDRVPQHFGSDGVDQYADKSVFSVFLPVLVPAGLLVVMAGTAYATLRMTPGSELPPGRSVSPFVNRPATRAGARRLARAQLFLAFCVGLTMAGACTAMWSTDPQHETATSQLLVLVLAPMAVGVGAVLLTALRDRAAPAAGRRGGPPTSG